MSCMKNSLHLGRHPSSNIYYIQVTILSCISCASKWHLHADLNKNHPTENGDRAIRTSDDIRLRFPSTRITNPSPPAVEKLFSDKDVDSKTSNITIAWTALHACDEKQETVKISRDFRTTHCSVVDKAQHSAWLNWTLIRWLLRQSQVTQSQQQAEYLTVFNRQIASRTKTWLTACNQ